MTHLKKIITAIVFISTVVLLNGCLDDDGNENIPLNVDVNGNSSFDEAALDEQLSAIPLSTLSQEEIDGLLLMREEEKLAHDVYVYLYDVWGMSIFFNISNSEQTHTDAVKVLIERYKLTDPISENTSLGEFGNQTLQDLYDILIATGKNSLIDALIVGATVEDLDIFDLAGLLEVTTAEDIRLVYNNLQKGSRNHLRSFMKNLREKGGNYSPQYISQAEFDEIIDSGIERGRQ